jgi:hypothetical protein
MSLKKYLVCLGLFSTVLFAGVQESRAGVVDVDTFGLSIHLGGSYSGAPLGLDRKGIVVFNPGVGLGYDFRNSALTSGFSPIVKAGVFADCKFIPLYYTTAGFRYSKVFFDDYTIGASFSLGVMNGEKWSTGARRFSIMPLPIFEIGRRVFKDDIIRLGTVYAPSNKSMSATSGGGLLFVMLSYGHSF